MEHVRRFEWGSMQAIRAGHVEIRFVNGSHFNLRSKRAEDLIDLFRTLAVTLGMAIHENGMRAHAGRRPEGHGGVHPKLPRLIRGGGDNSALVALAADDHSLAFERRK